MNHTLEENLEASSHGINKEPFQNLLKETIKPPSGQPASQMRSERATHKQKSMTSLLLQLASQVDLGNQPGPSVLKESQSLTQYKDKSQ